jgi:hypothetical protein
VDDVQVRTIKEAAFDSRDEGGPQDAVGINLQKTTHEARSTAGIEVKRPDVDDVRGHRSANRAVQAAVAPRAASPGLNRFNSALTKPKPKIAASRAWSNPTPTIHIEPGEAETDTADRPDGMVLIGHGRREFHIERARGLGLRPEIDGLGRQTDIHLL